MRPTMANFRFKLLSLSIHLSFCKADVFNLEWVGWDPSVTLSPCQGDCEYDEDCEGTSVCIQNSVPDGCDGTSYGYGTDYCSNPYYGNYPEVNTSTTETGPIQLYFLDDDNVTFADAEVWCDSLSLDLVSIHTDDQNADAFAECDTGDCWIGLYRNDTESEFEWTDGSNLDYTNWDDGEPVDDNNANCVYMLEDGKWSVTECSESLSPICGYGADLNFFGWDVDGKTLLDMCDGDCDSDDECKDDLICFHNDDTAHYPDGCTGTAHIGVDYCYSLELANEICSCCTAELCESITSNPTPNPTLPTVEPTHSPTATNQATGTPTGSPSLEPTYVPTLLPSEDPTTANPTVSPTPLPTEDPTSAPSASPSLAPSDAPSTAPSQHPTDAPSGSPTQPPTHSPSRAPTQVPTQSPSQSPTAIPITLQQALRENVDDELPFDDTATWMTIIVGGVGVIVLITSIVYGRGKCEQRRYTVDDQQMGRVLIYFMQLVDLYSDIILSIQFRLYYLWSKDRDWIPQRTVDILNWLFILSMAFVAVPYFGNIGSAMNVVQRISTDKVISRFSKEYFATHMKLYTLLVLLSGGSIRALKFMSSNLLGSPKLSSGLSPLQIQQFRAHHLIGTVLMENIPQLIMQGFFMFDLNMYTTTVLISFFSSVVNVVLSIKTEVDQCLANQNVSESPFTILLNWNGMGKESMAPVDPHARTGRREALSTKLSAITYGTGAAVSIQITSCRRSTATTEICGVLEFDGNIDTVDGVFERFEQKKEEIEFAVLRSFGLNSEYMAQYGLNFDIEIAQNSVMSRSERVEMTKKLMSEVGTDSEEIIEWEKSITDTNPVARQLVRTMGTRKILDFGTANDENEDTEYAERVDDHEHLRGGIGVEMAMVHHLQFASLSSVDNAGEAAHRSEATLCYVGPEEFKEDQMNSPTRPGLDHSESESDFVDDIEIFENE